MSSPSLVRKGEGDDFLGLSPREKSRLIRQRLSQDPAAIKERVDFFMATGEHMGQIVQDVHALEASESQ